MRNIQTVKRASLGQCRLRLTLEQAVDQVTDIGGMQRVYMPLRQVWASVRPMEEMYQFLAQRVESDISHVIQLRWCADLVATMRFRLEKRVFVIHACVDPEERRRTWLCFCEEVVG